MHVRIMIILVTLKGNYFVYLQVFSNTSGLSKMMLLSRFSNQTWWQSTFTKEILKKTEGRVPLINESYTFSLTSGKDYANEAIEMMMAKMNAN